MSHKLLTGFVTKGAALRCLGNKDLQRQSQSCIYAAERYSARPTPTQAVDETTLEIWIAKNELYMVQVTVGGAIGMWWWLAKCCGERKLWENPCTLWARGGRCETTFKIAMAILGIELVPGGSNLSPMLIDQAQDGEFK